MLFSSILLNLLMLVIKLEMPSANASVDFPISLVLPPFPASVVFLAVSPKRLEMPLSSLMIAA